MRELPHTDLGPVQKPGYEQQFTGDHSQPEEEGDQTRTRRPPEEGAHDRQRAPDHDVEDPPETEPAVAALPVPIVTFLEAIAWLARLEVPPVLSEPIDHVFLIMSCIRLA
jgi:hypothetical protein